MADPYHHATSSVRNWGGKPEDYLKVHQWFDESKAHFLDPRHRALRHHAEGIALCIQILGPNVILENGTKIPVRWVGEQHVREDLGWIPTVKDWLQHITPQKWMNAPIRLHKTLALSCSPSDQASASPTSSESPAIPTSSESPSTRTDTQSSPAATAG